MTATKCYTPYSKEIAHKMKGESLSGTPITSREYNDALNIAAQAMKSYVGKDMLLVPVPSRKGYATSNLDLVKLLSKETGAEYKDILKGKERPSSYEMKKAGGKVEDFGFYLTEQPTKSVLYVDNVISSGSTAKAVYECHKGMFLFFTCVTNISGFVNVNSNINSSKKPFGKRFNLRRPTLL